jgi:antitoxin CptB
LEQALSGTTISSEGLNERQRRLLLRSWRRGMRETDLILGRFADAHVATLSDLELTEFERLLDVRDQDLLGWVTGEFAPPAEFDTPFLRRLRDYHWNAGTRA